MLWNAIRNPLCRHLTPLKTDWSLTSILLRSLMKLFLLSICMSFLLFPSANAFIYLRRLPIVRSLRLNALSSTKKSNYYITTPIYYVNGLPHLGHAYTSVMSDIIARFYRKDERSVYFLTGTDEHGQKVEQSAVKANQSPLQFADEISDKFKHLTKVLGCSNTDFIRTTEGRHKSAVEALWKSLEQKGFVYLGAYEGWYSVRDEAFYTEDELIEGKAPTGADVEWVKEESYFFKLSAFTDKLLQYYEEHPEFIGPKGRRNEVISFVGQEGGLRDLSISRTTFSWGIPVPNDPKHVVYVWLDALTNYITAVGYPDVNSETYQSYWPADLHIVGKDILRFHAVFWPAFLMAAEIPLPKRIFAHGWWTKDGEKMSKSVGNVLDPIELLEQYGLDYFRYYLASEISFGNDGDFSHESFINRINSDLANDLGNLAQRVITLIQKHCDNKIPVPNEFQAADEQIVREVKASLEIVRQHMSRQNIKGVCETIINLAKLGNRYIDVQAPWVLIKTDQNRFNTVIYVLSEVIRCCAILLEPIAPSSCAKLMEQLGVPNDFRTFASINQFLPSGLPILSPEPIFPRIETEKKQSPDQPLPKKNKEKKSVPKVSYPEFDVLSATEVDSRIIEIGDIIRKLKAQKATKDDLQPLIGQLTYLKSRKSIMDASTSH